MPAGEVSRLRWPNIVALDANSVLVNCRPFRIRANCPVATWSFNESDCDVAVNACAVVSHGEKEANKVALRVLGRSVRGNAFSSDKMQEWARTSMIRSKDDDEMARRNIAR